MSIKFYSHRSFQGCDTCECSASGNRWKCKTENCPNSVQNGISTIEFACTPKQSFKSGCNICVCDSFGKSARCIESACGFRKRQKRSNEQFYLENLFLLRNSSFNKLFCPYSKLMFLARPTEPLRQLIKTFCEERRNLTLATTTPKSESKDLKRITEEDLADPNFKCIPQQALMLDCNTCWCSKSGKSLKSCTRIACRPKVYKPLDVE